ncbi:MAG: alcohol acetyltransferase [Podila humilis]|nr:MAG: alcohol acetyltransferase [Podila humilis]
MSQEKTELPLVRPVANLERYTLAQGNTNIYYNVVIGTRLQLQSNLKWPQDKGQWIALLSPALSWLVQQRPALSVVIGEHLSAHPTFRRLPHIDLNKIIRLDSIQHPEDIAKVMEAEHAQPFNIAHHEVPLWRIIVVHVKQDDTYYLLYNFQHSISDGRSGMMFSELLVERLNHEINSPTPATSNLAIIPTSNEPLPPSLEQRTDCRPSITTLIKELSTHHLLPEHLKRMLESKYWAGDIDASVKTSHETLVSYLALTQEETKTIVAAAKAHKTTVNTILSSASLFALKSLFMSDASNRANPSTTKDKLSISTAVALRNMISPPIDKYDQGVYVSEAVTKDIRVELQTSFWGLSHMYGASVIQATQTTKGRKSLLEHLGLLEYLPKTQGGWEEYMVSQFKELQHGRETTVRFSNLGKAWDQLQDEVGFKVLDPVFSQSACTTSSAFTFSAATANNTLVVTNTWQKSTFATREKADKVLVEMRRIMLEAAAKEDYSFHDSLANA